MHYSVGVGSEDSFQDLVSAALSIQGVSAAVFVNFGVILQTEASCYLT